MQIRYEDECKMLAYLAKRQLNLSKNRVKDKFEDLDLPDIYCLISEEIEELNLELIQPTFNLDNALAEIGDVAACLTGLVAWINKRRGMDAKTYTD